MNGVVGRLSKSAVNVYVQIVGNRRIALIHDMGISSYNDNLCSFVCSCIFGAGLYRIMAVMRVI